MQTKSKRLHFIRYFIGFLLLLAVLYGAVWGIIAYFIDQQVTLTRQNNAPALTLGDVSIGGFPARHNVKGTLRYEIPDTENTIHVPQFSLQSYFLPGHDLFIDLPEGLTFKSGAEKPLLPSLPDKRVNFAIKEADFDVRIPKSIPAQWTYQTLLNWRNKQHAYLPIHNFSIQFEGFKISGSGSVSLDQKLQPTLNLQTEIYNADQFLETLKDHDLINRKLLMALGFLASSLTEINEDTGEKYVALPIRIENQTFYLGAVNVGYIASIRWGSADSLPAPDQ